MIGTPTVTGILFQAIGKPILATFLSLSWQVLFLVPAMLVLGVLYGVEGVLWVGAFSDGLSGIISFVVVRIFWNQIFKD